MPKRELPTKTIKSSEALENWSKLLTQVHDGNFRVLVEKDGKPLAGVVSARDLEWLTYMEEQRERDFAVLDGIRAKFADVSEDELELEIAKAIEEVRAENRAK